MCIQKIRGKLCSFPSRKCQLISSLAPQNAGAQGETRTPKPLRTLAPEASVSTNSTTWARPNFPFLREQIPERWFGMDEIE